jgi:DNA-binding PadR family transcriptional regulator
MDAGRINTPSQAVKTLMVLGLLQSGPKHGYELHRIVLAHGSIYPDFKKPTLYHLLHRLAMQGLVQVRAESGARGRRGERLVFAIARPGELRFQELLRNALGSCDGTNTGFEVAVAFLGFIAPRDRQRLLRRRRDMLQTRRDEMLAELERMNEMPEGGRRAARQLAFDHALSLLDAELAWMDRAIREAGSTSPRKAAPAIAAAPLRRAVGA